MTANKNNIRGDINKIEEISEGIYSDLKDRRKFNKVSKIIDDVNEGLPNLTIADNISVTMSGGRMGFPNDHAGEIVNGTLVAFFKYTPYSGHSLHMIMRFYHATVGGILLYYDEGAFNGIIKELQKLGYEYANNIDDYEQGVQDPKYFTLSVGEHLMKEILERYEIDIPLNYTFT